MGLKVLVFAMDDKTHHHLSTTYTDRGPDSNLISVLWRNVHTNSKDKDKDHSNSNQVIVVISLVCRSSSPIPSSQYCSSILTHLPPPPPSPLPPHHTLTPSPLPPHHTLTPSPLPPHHTLTPSPLPHHPYPPTTPLPLTTPLPHHTLSLFRKKEQLDSPPPHHPFLPLTPPLPLSLFVVCRSNKQEEGAARFRSKAFNAIVTRKKAATLAVMQLGYDIVFADTDVVIVQDPLPLVLWQVTD